MEHAFSEPLARNAAKNEGKTTDLIERRTGQVPSGTYLSLAVGAMVASAALMFSARRRTFGGVSGRAHLANFVGQWGPALLTIGVYNKLVKIEHEMLRNA